MTEVAALDPNESGSRSSTAPALRIAFITHYTELYGANLSLLNLIEGLSRFGVQANVICPDQGDLMMTLAERGIPAAVIPFEWWVGSKRSIHTTARRMIQNVRWVRLIVSQIRGWNTDVVYSNSSVFPIGAMAAMELELPHVWHFREFGRRDYDLLPDLGLRLSRLVIRSADATIFVSNALRKAVEGRSHLSNACVIYNGVAWEVEFDRRRQAAEALRDRTQPFTFVLVGRFRESKGQSIAIRAFSNVSTRFPNTKLLLVGGAGQTGDQRYFDQCRELAMELGISDRTEFWGYVPDPIPAYLAADAALMCSRNEAMGRVTAEAMSVGLPVIGFDSGGTSELIDHEETGLLYQGDADALAESMIRYVAEPELARRHGEAGWVVARRRHSTEAYAAQINDVLRRVTGSKNRQFG